MAFGRVVLDDVLHEHFHIVWQRVHDLESDMRLPALLTQEDSVGEVISGAS